MKPSITVSLFAFIALQQCLDFWTTYRILSAGGREENPVLVALATFCERFGLPRWSWLVVAKGGVIAAAYYALVHTAPHPITLAVFVGVALWYAWVLWHNYREYAR